MRKVVPILGAVVAAGLGLAACDTVDDPLAPYEGERPLTFLAITESWAPDIQWVGGRAAAVGINRGSEAALDSTLVWLVTTDGNELDSPLRVGEGTDEATILELGGTPLDSLLSGEQYTFWVAEQSAFDAALTGAGVDSFSLADSTFDLSYALRGRAGGDSNVGVDIQIVRDQKLTSDRYIIQWTPADVGFRRIAIRDASVGGFSNLLWHVLIPDGEPGEITSPVVVGETPPGADVATPWAGFSTSTQTLWMVTEDWDGGFGRDSNGYVFFQIFANNFD